MFSTGMDYFDIPTYAQRRVRPNLTQPGLWQASNAAMDLPPNIRHHFGTTVCETVLADNHKVQQTLHRQRKQRDQMYRSNKKKPPIEMPPDDADPQYEALGLTLRQNTFPGFTYGHKCSMSNSVHTLDVHNRHVDPSMFRNQRDELSK